MQDTGHVLFDSFGCGSKRRETLDEQIKSGERSFREVSEEMWGSLNVPFEDGFEVMEKTLEIDPDFQAFHKFCIANQIPFNVISAGLKPVLRKVLDTFLGEEEVCFFIRFGGTSIDIFSRHISRSLPMMPISPRMARSGSQSGDTTRSSATTRPSRSTSTKILPRLSRRMERSLW